MKKIVLAVAGMAGIASVPASATNLVTNGGFEQTSVPGNFQFGSSEGAAGQVTGWDATGYNLLFNAATATTDSAAGFWDNGKEMLWGASASSQGGNFVAMDGDSNDRGPLTQTINGLTAGAQYLLTFEWGAGQLQSRDGATTEQLRYSLGDEVYTTAVLNNASHGFTGWNTVSQVFTATGASQVLSFLSIGTPNGLPPIAMLDNVSMAAVPEPATWAMMLVGFVMVGSAVRYRRRNASAAIA